MPSSEAHHLPINGSNTDDFNKKTDFKGNEHLMKLNMSHDQNDENLK